MTIRQPGRSRMPRWIWQEPRADLPISVKRFVRLIWRFDRRGCDWWNCIFAKYFKVTPRTIRRWISIAKVYPLISIAYGEGRNRVIRRLPYHSHKVFESQKPLWLAKRTRTQMSALDNAKHRIVYKTRQSYAFNAEISPTARQSSQRVPPFETQAVQSKPLAKTRPKIKKKRHIMTDREHQKRKAELLAQIEVLKARKKGLDKKK